MDLVIVESPTKAKTLSKFLGSGYKVVASMGHVRDLPKSQLGVNVENDFSPQYTIPSKARLTIKDLKEAAAQASTIWLSTDPDREGEAIAWHITQALTLGKTQNSKLKTQNWKRAVFHEITEKAVKEAFARPRQLDQNLINSQQARRVLDRLVGYKLSPLLWRKVARNLSAGRVQSVAVRLVVERERERLAFKSQEYWQILALLRPGKLRETAGDFTARLVEKNGQKLEVSGEKEAKEIEGELRGSEFKVGSVKREEKRRHPAPPFTTSTLQQTAGNKLGFTASRTMRAAQTLYEKGLITYMRTDSVNLSGEFLARASSFIKKEFGPAYAPAKPIQYKTKSRLAQEAHEAVRPTRLELGIMNHELVGDERRIYELIWKRAVSSQMTPAVFDATTIDVLAVSHPSLAFVNYLLRATGSVLNFDGWLKAWGVRSEKLKVKSEKSDVKGQMSNVDEAVDVEVSANLPSLSEGQDLKLISVASSQHFTEPPARYSEASLVKALEEQGIGRPSTYAPIINTIQNRGYVAKDGRYLYPQDVGLVVNDLLVANFPQIVDLSFTSKMEGQFDEIAAGKKDWVPVVRNFYEPFVKLLEIKQNEIKKEEVTTLSKTDAVCPDCGKPLVVKLGRFGKFLSCSGFPQCKFARPVKVVANGVEVTEALDPEQLGKCPTDEGELVVKTGRFGKFVACANYPNCKFTKPYLQKIGQKCPECRQGDVVVKHSKRQKTFFGCSRYPDCKFASWTKPQAAPEGLSPEPAKG